MQSYVVLLVGLLVAAIGASLWYSVALFNDSVQFSLVHIKDDYALEGLRAYAISLVCDDPAIWKTIMEKKLFVRQLPRWPVANLQGAVYSGSIRYTKLRDHVCALEVRLLSDGIERDSRAVLMYDADQKRMIVTS